MGDLGPKRKWSCCGVMDYAHHECDGGIREPLGEAIAEVADELDAAEAIGKLAAAPMKITAPGIYLDVPEHVYHGDPCPEPSLSSSIANVLVRQSPLHAHHLHPRLGRGPRRTSDAFDRGALIHKLVLGAGGKLRVIDAEDWRTKYAKAQREQARAAGETPVLKKQYDSAVGAAKKIRERLGDAGVELDGKSEVTLVWQEETSSGPIWCRARLDHVWLDRGRILDLKSSEDANPEACARSAANFGYDLQEAAYTRALEVLRAELAGRVEYLLAFVEHTAPHGVLGPVPLDGTFAERGRRRWRQAVETFAACLDADRWPGYERVDRIFAPGWVLRDLDQELVA